MIRRAFRLESNLNIFFCSKVASPKVMFGIQSNDKQMKNNEIYVVSGVLPIVIVNNAYLPKLNFELCDYYHVICCCRGTKVLKVKELKTNFRKRHRLSSSSSFVIKISQSCYMELLIHFYGRCFLFSKKNENTFGHTHTKRMKETDDDLRMPHSQSFYFQ